MLTIGYAARDITPAPGITLSGFAMRCNQPSQAVADPLSVSALAISQGDTRGLLLVFDLLGLGPEILEALHAVLDARLPEVGREERVLCCTHTHSAPATITLLGCGIVEPAYWDQVIAAAADAAAAAWTSRQPATLRRTAVEVAGENYNRRRLLADGRVVMAREPDGEVVKVGRTWDEMQLLRVDDDAGRPIAGIAHWAAHPCTVCTLEITADYPGELRRRLAAQHGFPFLFLQGACGDLNPPWDEMTYRAMQQNVDRLMTRLDGVTWPAPAVDGPFTTRSTVVPLAYADLVDADTLRRMRDGMDALSRTGAAPDATLRLLANILTITLEEARQGGMARNIAAALRDWAAEQLARADTPASCDLNVTAWRLGPLALCFIAAEVFVDYAFALREAFPDRTTLLVSYASPSVGYLPTDAAQHEGGYEVDQAYRFYNHPAPWCPGTEARVLVALRALLS